MLVYPVLLRVDWKHKPFRKKSSHFSVVKMSKRRYQLNKRNAIKSYLIEEINSNFYHTGKYRFLISSIDKSITSLSL